MNNWKQHYQNDLRRYGNKKINKSTKQFLKYFRKCQFPSNKLFSLIDRFFFEKIKNKLCIEISRSTTIGDGLYIGHPYGITINAKSIIGNNCNIHKGVLIGQENRGKRQGTPTIGNEVWIGINAAIVGKINIGNDVLIAPNSYVNCDVPSHSIVFGNPCVIKRKENATANYVNNKI